MSTSLDILELSAAAVAESMERRISTSSKARERSGEIEQNIPGIGLDLRLDNSVRHCARSKEENGPGRPLESQLRKVSR